MENESKEIMREKSKCQTEEFGKTKVLIFQKKMREISKFLEYNLYSHQQTPPPEFHILHHP